MESTVVNDLVHPFPEFMNAGLAISQMMRETYVARNPLTAQDIQRRHAIMRPGQDGVVFPLDWKSSARGYMIVAVSGTGKTTYVNACLLRHPQVIKHTSYNNKQLIFMQLVYVVLRVPHDATLKSLCIQFFREVDHALNTKYYDTARSIRNIAPMVELMHAVVTAVSLGFIVVDEVQNLKYARSGNAEFMLNLFSEIIERLGVSLLLIATPAVSPVLSPSVRNLRKIISNGQTVFPPMGINNAEWHDFSDAYYDYAYVKHKKRLTKSIRNAWHKCSAGNCAFAALTFVIAQRNEIGGREFIDEDSFMRVSATDMAFLQPAIRALNSRKPKDLLKFDDLLFGKRYDELRALLKTNDDPPEINEEPIDEFDDISEDDNNPTEKKRRIAPKGKTSTSPTEMFEPPMEDPLLND
jgi:hypothetical protein